MLQQLQSETVPVRATAILNLGSGAQRKEEIADALVSIFSRHGGDLRVGFARRVHDVYDFAREAVNERRVVLAGGGDGTISAVASIVAGSDAILGILPTGTFNLFAREMQIPLDIESAAELCFEGTVRAVDLAEVNGRIFLNHASMGLHPAMLRVREEAYRRWGRSRLLAYISALIVLLRRQRYLHAHISTGEESGVHRTPLIFAARNPVPMDQFGVEGSDCIKNGKLAFYVVPPVNRRELLTLAIRMFFRQLAPARDFQLVCADEARIAMRSASLNVAYDGELERMHPPLLFRIRRNALKLLVPRISQNGTL